MTEREQLRIDIKKRLNSYRELNAERRQILDELNRLEALMSSPSGPNLDGMPRSPGVGNPVERMVIKHITLQEKYRAQLVELTTAQELIEGMIEGLEPVERRLARFRYIDGLTWEDVCEKLCYSWRQTHRIHGRMLDKLVTAEIDRGRRADIGKTLFLTKEEAEKALAEGSKE